jgi:hypothetical protein
MPVVSSRVCMLLYETLQQRKKSKCVLMKDLARGMISKKQNIKYIPSTYTHNIKDLMSTYVSWE